MQASSSLLTRGFLGFSGVGPEDSDTLCIALGDVHGELVALRELGRTFGPQHHGGHVLQICTTTKSHLPVLQG